MSERVLVSRTFDPEVAKVVGTDSAIIFENILYWIAKNQANESNFNDGRYWTFNSVKAFQKLFFWLSEKQISTCINKLISSNFLVVGNYNQTNYDRTRWYAIGDAYKENPFTKIENSNLPNGKIENLSWENRSAEVVSPIPNINTNIKPNIFSENKKQKKTSNKEQELLEFITHFNLVYEKNYRVPTGEKGWVKNYKKWCADYSLEQMKEAVTKSKLDSFYCDKLTPDMFFRTNEDRISRFLELKAKPKKSYLDLVLEENPDVIIAQ